MPKALMTATHFVMSYQQDTALGDITFSPEACASMTHWTAPGVAGAPVGFSDNLISTNGTLQTREASIPRSNGAYFLRIKITQP
ncbi:MAG: hypothetical protein H8M99_10790 [Gloeobacteraceae cyanobacterium ES-bin-144]|nr:hypothetical protein [Verrucomicrobiales bacterium]